MSDQSLRDALEKLADDYEYIPSFRVAELVAAHPVEPAKVCSCPPHPNPEYSTPGDWDPACLAHQPAAEWTDEERGFVEQSLLAADSGNAGHWPTVATYLAAEVRRLRAIHPAEPAGVSDEAVEAAAKALHIHDKLDPWNDDGCNDNGGGAFTSCHDWTIQGARAALEAAQPFMQPQVVASREAVRERLWRSLAGTGVTGIFRDELAEAQTDALLAAGVFRLEEGAR